MALVKIENFDANYFDAVGDKNVINYSVYSDVTNEKIGTIEDILVDEENGHLRYWIVDIGFWIFGKKILLPVDSSQISFTDERVYAKGFTKEQAEQLPEFNESLRIDNEYEEQVSTIYPPQLLNSPNTTELMVDPASPVAPSSITMGTLTSLTSPLAPPYPLANQDLEVDPEHHPSDPIP